MSALVVASESQFSNRTIPSLFALSKGPLFLKHSTISPFLNFGSTHQNRLGPLLPFQPKKKSSDLSAGLFVDSKGKLGGNFQLKRPGFGVKVTGITDFNGDNNVFIGMNIPLRRKRSRSRSRLG